MTPAAPAPFYSNRQAARVPGGSPNHQYFPEAAGAVKIHDALCGWVEEGGAI
jgi:hypothetical protein